MSRTFTKISVHDCDNYQLRETSTFIIDNPLTVLVGCNGSGKTTLMAEMQKALDNEGIPWSKHYALESKSRISYAVGRVSPNDTDVMQAFAATTWASEGERIKNGFAYLVQELGDFVYNKCKNHSEAWIFLDSLDSGMSIDNIREVIAFLENTVLAEKPAHLDLHIVIAANAFELAKQHDCLDVQMGTHHTFDDYDDYADFIMETSHRKEKYINTGPIDISTLV